MGYEQLSLGGFIKEMKEVSDGFHPRKFCFVLGAGASRTSGIKTGQELVKIWDNELKERNRDEYDRWRRELSITDENMSSFYSHYYEKRFGRCRSDGYNYIEKIMGSAKPSAGYVMLAHLLTQTPHNVVITTNFDHLTEDAVNYYAQNTPLIIGHESLSHYVSGQPVRPTIIKIHRDLLFDPKSRSEDLEKLPDSWKTALELIFANYHPVFIGYAGNDRSLMDFLVENAGKFADDVWKYPYWMLYRTEALAGKTEEFLEKSNGYFIRHNGFDDVLIQLGAAFDYKIPTEDAFLEDARKRYKALADAIDAFSDASKNMAESISCDTAKSLETISAPDDRDEDETYTKEAIEKITSQSNLQRMYREAANYMEAKDYTSAAKILKQLVALDDKNSRYHNSFGDALFQLDQNEEALHEYRKAIELEPENGNYHWRAAITLIKVGRNDEALTVLREAAKLDPEGETLHYVVASLFELINQFEDALAEYRKALALNPNSAMNHYCVAKMLEKTGQYEDALRSIETAISLNPDYPYFYDVLSLALRGLGRTEEAKVADKKAKELKKA